jgi:hypothetical protein
MNRGMHNLSRPFGRTTIPPRRLTLPVVGKKMSDDILHVLVAFEEHTGTRVSTVESRCIKFRRATHGYAKSPETRSDYVGIYVVERENVAGGVDELLHRREVVLSEPLAEGTLLTFPRRLVHRVTALASRDMVHGGRRRTLIITGHFHDLLCRDNSYTNLGG